MAVFEPLEACLKSKEAVFWQALSFSVHGIHYRWSKVSFAEVVCIVAIVTIKDHCPLWVAYDFLLILQPVVSLFFDKIFWI